MKSNWLAIIVSVLTCLTGFAEVQKARENPQLPAYKNAALECLSCCPASAAESQPVQVSPGVWRLRFGNPEAVTPVSIRSAEPVETGFAKLPACERSPLDPARVSCQITPARTIIRLPGDAPDQHQYGFGLDPDCFIQNGLMKRPRLSSSSEGGRRAGKGPGSSHAPVPAYFSTAGYGVYVDTARVCEFHLNRLTLRDAAVAENMGAEGASGLSLEALYERKANAAARQVVIDIPGAPGVDVYLFAGPDLLSAVRRYNLFAGGGAMPPMWGLGVKCRTFVDADEALVKRVSTGLREHGIPCDMLGLEPKWQSRAYPCSFVWSRERFPDPERFISDMNRSGYKLNLWWHAFVHPQAPFFQEIQPFCADVLSMRGLVPDLMHPKAVAILQRHFERELIAHGIDGFKIDECDRAPGFAAGGFNFPNATVFPSGVDGEAMGEMFGLLLQKHTFESFRKSNRRTWSDVRASGALAAPLPFVLYSDTEDLTDYVRQLCNASFTGLLWSPETRNADNPSHLQRRLMVSTFSNQFCLNPWFNRRPIWENYKVGYGNWGPAALPEDEQAKTVRLLRYSAELRMRFLPYLYSAYYDYAATGRPPVRALVLDFPSDPKVRSIDHEFMFGASILVAPFLYKHTKMREVYLPEACAWRDFWTGQFYRGGQTLRVKLVERDGIENTPLFVRDNRLVPMADPVQFVASNTVFHVKVRAFGDKPEPFTLFEDDGVSYDYTKGKRNCVAISFQDGKATIARTGSYSGRRDDLGTEPEAFDSPQAQNLEETRDADPAKIPGAKLLNGGASWKASSSLSDAAVSGRLLSSSDGDDVMGFHTAQEENANVVIDLKLEKEISGLRIENRKTPSFRGRADTLAVWLSTNGNDWRKVWEADEVKPVWHFVLLSPQRARYVKLGLQRRDFLHLRRVHVYGM